MKSYSKKLLAGAALLATLSAAITTEAFIAGGKAPGMAGVGVAYAQDAYAGANNPAGIVDVSDRIDFGIDWIQDRGHAKVIGNASPTLNAKYDAFKTKDVYNPDFGINKTFCTETCGCVWEWAVGLVMYNRDYQKTTYNTAFPLLGTTNLGLEYLHETIAPVFAFRINECVSAGVSIDVHVQRAKVNGIQNFDNPLLSRFPGHVTNKGYDYGAGVGATLGLKWQVNDSLSAGVTYRTKAKVSTFTKYRGFLAQSGMLNTPQKVAVGLAYKFMPCATIAFDVEWIDWHGIRSLHNPLLNNPNATAITDLTQLGAKNGPGFGFRNQTFYRVGIDYQLNDKLTLRAGYRHANCPLRRSQTAVNLLTCDAVEDFITFGATYAVNSCLEATVFYGKGFSHRVKGRNSIPAFLGGGNVNLTESKDALGVSIGYLY